MEDSDADPSARRLVFPTDSLPAGAEPHRVQRRTGADGCPSTALSSVRRPPSDDVRHRMSVQDENGRRAFPGTCPCNRARLAFSRGLPDR